MTSDEFKKLAAVMRPRMLEEIRKYRPQAHGRLTEADEEEIVNDAIASLYKRMADLPEDDANLWKRFMARMHGRFIDFLRKCGPIEVSLDARPFPDGMTLEERIPSTKYAPDRASEQAERESALSRLMELLRTVPMLPRYRRVVDLCYLDSPESLGPAGTVEYGAVAKVAEMEKVDYEAAKKLIQRARVALRKAVIAFLSESKDPLLHLVQDSELLVDRSEEL